MRELVRLGGQAPHDDYACERHLNDIVRQIDEQMNQIGQPDASAAQAVAETMRAIVDHCERSWSREMAARSMRFNLSHFSRAFRQQSGCSFSAFVNKVRLNRARLLLLLTTDLTLDGIAHQTGFLNGLYLSRRFKQDCGLSPTAYREALSGRPLRIAAMQQAGDWLALGIVPVAVSLAPWHASPLLHEELLAGGATAIYELEDAKRLAEARPDLIVIPDYMLLQNASRLQSLEQIAHVLIVSPFRNNTLDRLRLLARIVGKQDEAERWIARYEAEAAVWRRRLAALIAPGESVALYELRGEDRVVVWPVGMRGSFNLYEALQLQPPDAVRREVIDKRKTLMIPLAELPRYAADHMFVITGEANGSHAQFYDAMAASPVWSALPACRLGRLYRLPLQPFWADDAAALEKQLPLLVSAVENATEIHAKNA